MTSLLILSESSAMKRWIILATLVVVFSGVATIGVQYLPGESDIEESKFGAPTEGGPQPLAVVEGDLVYKFDSKSQQEKFDHTWIIKNKGDADLVLHLQSTTCMCTVAEFPKVSESDSITIKPGGETPLHLTFETKDTEGRYSKSATVGTNDPKHPTITVGTDGSVYPAIIVKPTEKGVYFASIPNDVESSERVALFSPDRPEMKITKVTSSRPDVVVPVLVPLSALDRISLKCKGGWRMSVNIKPGMPLGRFHESIVLQTDHPKQSEVRIEVAGKVDGPIAAKPEHLSLPSISGKNGGDGNVLLTVRGMRDTTFKVAKAPEKLKVNVGPMNPAKNTGVYKMTVTVAPGTAPGQIEDEIILTTDHPQAAILKIPVNIFVNGPSS